jgi:hypothetical protein
MALTCKILLLCGLLCGLGVTTQSEVKEIVFPSGSRLTKTLVKLGLTEYIFPQFSASLRAFKSFKSREFKRMASVREIVDKIKGEMADMKEELQNASKKFQHLQKECFASLSKQCPACIFTACQKRAESVCEQQELSNQKGGQDFKFDCNCPRMYPQCQVGLLVCEKVGTVPEIIKGVVTVKDNGAMKAAGKFLVVNVEALLHVATKLVGSLEEKTVPDFLLDGIGKFIEDIADFENFLTGDLTNSPDGLEVVEDTASDVDNFVVGSTHTTTDENWDTAEETEDDSAHKKFDKIWIGSHGIRKNFGPRFSKKHHLPSEHLRPKRFSLQLPTCSDITANSSSACEMYRYHPRCTKHCNPTHVCPTVEFTHEHMESLNDTLAIARMSYNRTAISLQLANKRFKERFGRCKRALCWSQLLAKHYRRPTTGFYDITKVVSFYDDSNDKYLNVTATVHMGSVPYQYQGNIIFEEGFNPMDKTGAQKIAEQALVWYKTKLTENKACSSL